MAEYVNPCDNTTGQTAVAGTSLPTASGGTYSNGTSGTQRTATILHGITITNKAQIKLTGYGSGSAGSVYVLLGNIDPSDANPFVAYGLQITNTAINLYRVTNAVTFTLLNTAARTVSGAVNHDYRLEIEDVGATNDFRVYEDDVEIFTDDDATHDITTLTRLASVLVLGGSGGNSLTEYSVANVLDSEAGGTDFNVSLGDTDLLGMYLGDTQVLGAYLGDVELF